MADADFNASKYAGPKLMWHILQKGFQAGSLVGLVVVTPILAFRSRRTPMAELTPRLAHALATSATAGTVLTGLLGAGKMSTLNQEGLEDRVYRLHFNEGQNRTDKFAQAGSLLGAAAAAALLGPSAAAVLGGAAGGAAVGTLAHVATAERDNTPNKMVHELKRTE